MNTKLLLSASAITMGVLAIAGIFAPHELLTRTDISPTGVAPLFVQILAALFFGFAMVNWAARGSLMGGIYGRPIAIGNLAHFIIGALALVKSMMAGQRLILVVILTAIYVVFALAFGAAFFRSPVSSSLRDSAPQ